MLSDDTIVTLKTALNELQKPTTSAGAWNAISPLAALLDTDTAFTIDMRATDKIGTPVIVATPTPRHDTLLAPLTKRQSEVAQLIISGKSNKQIARDLTISLGTTKDHVHAILKRLELPTRSALIAAAAQSTLR